MQPDFNATPFPPVNIQASPIEYFKLTKAHFSGGLGDNLHVDINDIDSRNGYLGDESDLNRIDLTQLDTTLLNFQTGKGKTRLLYDYIQKYLDIGGYVIFYCAPFKRLLKQNQLQLKKRGISVHNFVEEPKAVHSEVEGMINLLSPFTSQVLLMTPEFLLGSGGKKIVRQKKEKREKFDEILKDLEREGRKVILIIDEIHEETDAYSSFHLHQLYKLTPVIGKIFIASATFTRESVEVTKAISLLTKRNIVVYQADRIPQSERADLHFHVCEEAYSSTNLVPLHGLSVLLDSLDTAQHRVHILTAHKTMTEALTGSGAGQGLASLKSLEPKIRVLTSSSNKEFDPSRHSIGTTFRTGVDIEDPGAVFIIILPGSMEHSSQEMSYGTFTDGLVALVQSLARLRKGGDVHIFMPPFSTYINTDIPRHNAYMERLIHYVNSSTVPKLVSYKVEEDIFDEFTEIYEDKKQKLASFLGDLEKMDGQSTNLRQAYETHIGMESLYDFILSNYGHYKMTMAYSMGKEIIPALFDLALRDQFVTCTLKTVFVESYKVPTISLGGSNVVKANLRERLADHWSRICHLPLFSMLAAAINILDEEDDGNSRLYRFGSEHNNRKEGTMNELIYSAPAASKALLSICLDHHKLVLLTDSPVKLFKTLVENATPDSGEIGNRYYAIKLSVSDCQEALCRASVGDDRERFVKEIISDNIPQEMVQKLDDALSDFSRSDPFYRTKQVVVPGNSGNSSNGELGGDVLKVAAEKLIVDSITINLKTKRNVKRRSYLDPDISYRELVLTKYVPYHHS